MLSLIHCFCSETKSERNRRHLVYPSGTTFNVLIGIGIPMQIDDSVASVGLFLDFNYDVPTNESLYNYVLYNQLQTISSRKLHTFNEPNKNKWSMVESDLITEAILEEENTSNEKVHGKLENNKPTKSQKQISKRSESITFENELNVEKQIVQEEYEDVQVSTKLRKNRWYFYNILEKYAPYIFTSIKKLRNLNLDHGEGDHHHAHSCEARTGQLVNNISFCVVVYNYHGLKLPLPSVEIIVYKINGRPCLLRAICDTAHLPFTHENGLLGEILHILLTPSTSMDELSHHTDNEYLAAERLGRLSRDSGNDCRNIFSDCKESFMDMFTKIYEL